MPKFVYAYENIDSIGIAEANVTVGLNKTLKALQEKGAEILDVKVSICSNGSDEVRTYLVIYEAENQLQI